MNIELFQKVNDRIIVEGNLGMSTWESGDPSCGTTRCVAGWAVYETTGKGLYRPDGGFSDETIALAKEHGGWIEDEEEPQGGWVDFEVLGMALLSLEGDDRVLFFESDEIAGRVVALFAEGHAEAARALLHGAR